jgi:hypothetical protein
MSFRWAWSWPALSRFYDIPYPASEQVDAAVLRFTRERAPLLPTGEYRFTAAGHAIRVQVDARERSVLVLYVFRLR